jgi:hypothetical protein
MGRHSEFVEKAISGTPTAGESVCTTTAFQEFTRQGGAGIQPARGFFNKL